MYPIVEDLKTTSGWVVSPRLITAEEVNNIIGNVNFDSTNKDTWYYFDTQTQTRETFTESKRSNYNWLYNNLNLCKSYTNGSFVADYGCNIEDNNTYIEYGTEDNGDISGYWTTTPVGTAGSLVCVWHVFRAGSLDYNHNANNSSFGVRPVITIFKSIIS